MKKIIFLFFIFSKSVFAFPPFIPYVSMVPYFESDAQFSLNYDANFIKSLVGKYTDCFFKDLNGIYTWSFSTKFSSPLRLGLTSCYILGWFPAGTRTISYPLLDETYLSPPPCPDSAYSSYYIFHKDTNVHYSNESGFVSGSNDFDRFYVCEMPDPASLKYLFVSQKAVSKTNDLISESNSKLGSIASSNSKISDLLNSIKDTLFALLSKHFAVFGIDSNSNDSLNRDNPDSSEFEPILSNSEIDLTNIDPLITGNSSQKCPSDVALTLAGSTHYFSFQPICDFSKNLNPFVIAAARVSAAWLVLGAL